jgi:hypothetical protein
VRFGCVLAACVAVWVLTVAGQPAPSAQPFKGLLHEHPAIEYHSSSVVPPAIVDAARKLEAGAAYDPKRGYLAPTLEALGVPISSQLLLFSKTGIQQSLTSPQNPRAFYFNDQLIVSHVPGAAFMEVAVHDASGGARFYTLSQDPAVKPAFVAATECLRCHVSSNTMEVPGFIARSMYTGRDGRTHPKLGSYLVDHRRDYAERWGGWFVTGAPDSLRHLGNTIVSDPEVAPQASASDVPSLEGRAPVDRYMSPYSDVTALAVFDHQMHAMNLITRLGWEARVAAASTAPDVENGPLGDLLREAADYLLLVDEAPLEGPVSGGSGFAEWFTAQGPRDAQGRSLREFDRRTRLFRYPGSFMIYSAALDGVPAEARQALYARMKVILEGADPAPRYQRLPAADRRAVLEILRETKREWR